MGCSYEYNPVSFRQNRIVSKAIRDHILEKYKRSKKQVEKPSHFMMKESKIPTVIDSQSTINEKQFPDYRQNFLQSFKERSHRKNKPYQQMRINPKSKNKYSELIKQHYLDYYNTAKDFNINKKEAKKKNKKKILTSERELSNHSKKSKKQRSSQNLYQFKNSIPDNRTTPNKKRIDKQIRLSANRLIDKQWIKLEKDNFQIQHRMKKKNKTIQNLNHKRYRSVAITARTQMNLEKSFKKAKKSIFKDSRYRNQKHQKDHLYNTYELQNRLREQIINQLDRANSLIKHKK